MLECGTRLMPDSEPKPTDELEPAASHDPSRRAVLAGTAAIAGACGAMVAVPVGALFAAPAIQADTTGGTWVPLGPVEEFASGRVEREYSYAAPEGWYSAIRSRRVVVGKEGEEWLVLSTRCTHLGCGVTWQPEAEGGPRFVCPCHNGIFDPAGKPVSGPPSRPLERLEARVENGILMVKEV